MSESVSKKSEMRRKVKGEEVRRLPSVFVIGLDEFKEKKRVYFIYFSVCVGFV